MKKNPIAYLLLTVSILSLGIPLVEGLIGTYSQIVNIPKSAIPDLNRFLIALPAFLLWIPIAFLLSNCVLFIIPKLLCRTEKHDTMAKEENFAKTQKRLFKLVLAFAAVCFPLIITGFFL